MSGDRDNPLPAMDVESILFDVDTDELAAGYFRQTANQLGRWGLAPSPLYYTLTYNYVAGKSDRLNEEMDQLLEQLGSLDRESAMLLYQRFFSAKDGVLIDDIRGELVAMIAQIIGSLVDIAGETSLMNKRVAKQIDDLARHRKPSAVVTTATAILAETRQFATRSVQLESDLMSSAEEMSRLKKELSNAKREAAIDSLTGLYNRRAFDRRMKALIKEAGDYTHGFSLLLLDIDHFKRVNDRHGHMVGDKVLRALGEHIGKLTRRSDFLARYGGEEFAVVLPDTQLTEAFAVAENIRGTLQRIRLRRACSKEPLEAITISIGVASHRAGESMDALIERCDKALYQAKRLGRNRSVMTE